MMIKNISGRTLALLLSASLVTSLLLMCPEGLAASVDTAADDSAAAIAETDVITDDALSDAEKSWLSSHDTIRVGYLDDYLPYSSTAADGDATGIVRDLVPEIFLRLGREDMTVEFYGYQSYDDMTSAIRSEDIDVAFPVGGDSYYTIQDGIVKSAAVASASTDLVYRGAYTDSVVSHFAVNQNNRMQYYYIATNFPDADITVYPTIDDCLDAVLSGEASATTLNGLRANDILKNRKYDNLSLKQLSAADDRCFGVKIGNDGLSELINHSLSVIGTEYIHNIAYLYAGELYTYTFSDMLRDYIWLFLALLLMIVLLAAFFIARDLVRSRKANRMKSDFVSHMSHEIRTPITAILGMNELILREDISDQVRQYADNIEQAGETLLGIINDILDFSKIEAGRMELIEDSYSLPELLDGIFVMLDYRAREKGLTLTMTMDPDLPLGLIGDEQKIRQILINLLTNAIKYTETGSILLSVKQTERTDEYVTLEAAVSDTGIGIRKEEMDKLFSAFDRLDLKRTGSIEGSGLGLAITQHMLSMMDSHIAVESTYEKGSVFSFVLRQKIADPTPVGAYETSSADEQRKTTRRGPAAFKAPDVRILIVDDTPMNLQVICGLLKRNQMQLDTAKDGHACIRQVQKNDYDLILLDQRMPGMDGVETLAELKRRFPERMTDTPVISLTANVLSGAREQMLAAGFCDYLTKPPDPEVLEQTLLSYLPTDKVEMTYWEDAPEDHAKEDVLPPALYEIDGLDVASGIRYCGDEEDYTDALAIYRDSCKEKADQIEAYLTDEDIEDYTLLVHSLKSTSNAIGANQIAALAKALEEAANDNNTTFMQQHTAELLRLYRHLGDTLHTALNE